MYFHTSLFSFKFSRLFLISHTQRVPRLQLQISNSVFNHAKLLFSPSIQLFLYNFQNLFWFSTPFFSANIINQSLQHVLTPQMKYHYIFSLKFSFELYMRAVVLFILILFHHDSPQLSDYPCLHWQMNNQKIQEANVGTL